MRYSPRPIRFIAVAAVVVVVVSSMPCPPPTHTTHSAARTQTAVISVKWWLERIEAELLLLRPAPAPSAAVVL
jgi:hypothetical protein